MPTVVPALGHDVNTDCRTHSVDLSAQKLSLSAPNSPIGATGDVTGLSDFRSSSMTNSDVERNVGTTQADVECAR